MYHNPIDECLEKGEYHVERIRCPECNYIQQAEVIHTLPYSVYVHHCRNCGHIIMESEWNCIDVEIKLPFSMKRFFNSVTTLEIQFILAVVVLCDMTMSLHLLVTGQLMWWLPLATCGCIIVLLYVVLLYFYIRKKQRR